MSLQSHKGGCQCGAVRYEVDVDIDNPIACNCSRCGRVGTILSFAPAENFMLLSGADSLTVYKFNKHVIDHQFCKFCGVQSFSLGRTRDGKEMAAINVRCLDGVDANELEPRKVDGRSF